VFAVVHTSKEHRGMEVQHYTVLASAPRGVFFFAQNHILVPSLLGIDSSVTLTKRLSGWQIPFGDFGGEKISFSLPGNKPQFSQ
jgi:hypothetical protein